AVISSSQKKGSGTTTAQSRTCGDRSRDQMPHSRHGHINITWRSLWWMAFTAIAVTLGMLAASAQRSSTLRLAVNTTTIESAPLFVAAEGPGGAALRVSSGGIAQLVSLEADAATNS